MKNRSANSLVAAPPPAPHGGDGARLAAALGIDVGDVLDLSASLNPVAPDPVPVLAAHVDAVGRYPDPTTATVALAALMRVDPSLLVLTNGGSEAIALVAAETGPGWVLEPEFSLYKRHLREISPAGGRWRSNPSNPLGCLAAPTDTAAVWDEAFWPLATGSWTRGDSVRGAVVLGSLTKLLACPGLRVGYILCPDDEFAKRVRKRQPEWSLNGIAASALPELLEAVDLDKWSTQVAQLRDDLAGVLRAAGLEPLPSEANWLLVRAPGLRDRLAPHGICVRDCATFGMEETVRIAVPPAHGLERLAAALQKSWRGETA